jgi:pimeloyl-ACP methyl ester carboxylesterase
MDRTRADDWWSLGSHFSWHPASEKASPVDIFHVEMGEPDAAVVLLIHGWPTCSMDFFAVAQQLSTRFRVCALDFPGYGFSDKPREWGYTLRRDEELVEFYLSEIIGARAAIIIGHDRGDSVALLHAARCAQDRSKARLEHLVLSNGNIFLPMSQLIAFQRQLLDKESGPAFAATLTAARLAEGFGRATMFPPRVPGDPDVEDLMATFSHADGAKILDETIQYLVERSEGEQVWLRTLSEASFPVTLIWGLYDAVSPPRVANYVWHKYLMQKPGGNRLYFIPDANHYLQIDRPEAFVQVVLDALDPAPDQGLGFLEPKMGAPLLVDVSRERLPDAGDLLHEDASPS